MTKTQDELLAAVERVARMADWFSSLTDAPAPSSSPQAAKDLRLILAALRSPDPEVERLRGALERIASGLPGVRAVHRLTEAQSLARAALSSNSGGR